MTVKKALVYILFFASLSSGIVFAWGGRFDEKPTSTSDINGVPASKRTPNRNNPSQGNVGTGRPVSSTNSTRRVILPIYSQDEKIRELEIKLEKSKKEVAVYNQSLMELRSFLVSLGVPATKANKMQMPELLSEMRIRLGDSKKYSGQTLSKENLTDLDSYLCDAPEILKIIKNYNVFIKDLSNKRIIIIDSPRN